MLMESLEAVELKLLSGLVRINVKCIEQLPPTVCMKLRVLTISPRETSRQCTCMIKRRHASECLTLPLIVPTIVVVAIFQYKEAIAVELSNAHRIVDPNLHYIDG